MNWSKYQEAIFNEVATGKSNLVINAVAGSGKTTVLVESYNRLPRYQKVLFLAFNKHIVKELSGRLPGADCMTIHSLGYKALASSGKKPQVSEYKIRNILDDSIAGCRWLPVQFHAQYRSVLVDFIDKARLTLTELHNETQVDALVSHFGMANELVAISNTGDLNYDMLYTEMVAIGRDTIKTAVRQFERQGLADFTDMLYLPCRLNLPVSAYDVVMVDEAQDLSAAQLQLVMLAARGRIIAVGDPRQAINGFAGADCQSFNKITERTNSKVMPLSVCYRCPASHLDLARAIVPEIEAKPDAATGTIEDVTEARLPEMIHAGDLVICRINAPLVSVALKLIASGIQARIRGRNIAAGLVKLIKDATLITPKPDLPQDFKSIFPWQLNLMVEHRLQMLATRENTETAMETLRDQRDCISYFLAGKPNITSTEQLCTELEALFADENASVWLSSIHRAKGLEADRVFVVNPDQMALERKNQQDWQKEQEQNLKYVGLTRSKQALYFVK